MDEKVFWRISYGMYVVTAWHDGKPTGCIANTAVQVTASPAMIAVSISRDNFTNACIKNSGGFGISILSENTPANLIGNFGFATGRDKNKFNGIDYGTAGGYPILKTGCGYIVCELINTVETHTHTIFIGLVKEAETLNNEAPMTYAYYHKVIKGRSPKNAPTYIADEKPKSGDIYKCSVCGYEYDGDIPFDQLPEDYKCPVCGQPKPVFEKIYSKLT